MRHNKIGPTLFLDNFLKLYLYLVEFQNGKPGRVPCWYGKTWAWVSGKGDDFQS
jgi:hypothetical protein